MYKRFEFIITAILSYVTCGIYGLYLYYKVTDDVNNMAGKEGIKPVMAYIPALLLGIVTCGIYSIYWMYKFCELQYLIAEKRGISLTPDSAILAFICMYVPVLQIFIICENFNKLADSYNG